MRIWDTEVRMMPQAVIAAAALQASGKAPQTATPITSTAQANMGDLSFSNSPLGRFVALGRYFKADYPHIVDQSGNGGGAPAQLPGPAEVNAMRARQGNAAYGAPPF
jgi:hypothetical protein